jgi:hypothetical protein
MMSGRKENFKDNNSMKKMIILLVFITFSSWAQSDLSLKPFVTDYCTAYAEGTRAQPNLWKHCCEEHDLYFWAGGSLEDRKTTDLRLRACVEKTGAKTQAALIYAAVSIGGSSPIRFKTKQWGNSWIDRKRYLSLSETETATIIQYLETHNFELSVERKQSFKEQLHSRLDSK